MLLVQFPQWFPSLAPRFGVHIVGSAEHQTNQVRGNGLGHFNALHWSDIFSRDITRLAVRQLRSAPSGIR